MKRQNQKLKGRKVLIEAYPWLYGEAHKVIVVDAMDMKSDQRYTTDIVSTCTGFQVGLMFELAGKIIIDKIKCPKCEHIATLNLHWQAFQCEDAIWEVIKQLE